MPGGQISLKNPPSLNGITLIFFLPVLGVVLIGEDYLKRHLSDVSGSNGNEKHVKL